MKFRGGLLVSVALLASLLSPSIASATTITSLPTPTSPEVAHPTVWFGQNCSFVRDSYYGDSGVICTQINISDFTNQFQSLTTFESLTGNIKRISTLGAGVRDTSTGEDVGAIGYVNVAVSGTNDYLSSYFFIPSPFDHYFAYDEEPCIFWQNGGIACVPYTLSSSVTG